VPYDLYVFDNGSCKEVKDYLAALLEDGSIRYLHTASENIGKIGAFKMIFQAAPGEVVAYSDDDIFFYPGWLGRHLEVLDGFPGVGMVSGCAVRTLFDHGFAANQAFAHKNADARLIHGQNIPVKWEEDWAESYGRDVADHLEAIRGMQDVQMEYRGLRAYAIANHNQFVTPKAVINSFLPDEWSGRLMGQMKELDDAVAEGGYLRLSTLERTTRHIGNMVSPDMAAEAERFSVKIRSPKAGPAAAPPGGMTRRLMRWRPVRWFFQGLYNRLFWILSDQEGGWLGQERER
jgi:glycosyltransferase involved in cell wall biosynthesis